EHPPSHHRTCIIALADEMDDELRAELQDLGADDSLGKPISLSELIYKIQKLSTGGRDVKPADYASAFLRQIRSLPDTESPDFFTAAATLGHDMMGTTTVISNNRLSELAQRLNDAALRGHAREVANFLGQVCSELTKLTQASESARQV
ncbi:hypothetical protein KKH27_03650, partial [bacterium]|nr:hypothetical protein [bacterium]MBU1984283.1 hypothetical protein [bacterium]